MREILDSGTMTGPVNGLEDYQKFCTRHMRAPMPGTNVEQEQSLWERAKDPSRTYAAQVTRALATAGQM